MIGKTVSHYRILEKLGEGGMGVVYRAEDLTLGRTIALKFLPPELTRDAAAKERFKHEARAASALDHPNICTIHEINETDDGQMFIAMACYKGETLKKKIERGPMDLNQAIRIAIEVGEGLAKAHSLGIVHRDIKPANVMITDDNVAKILDFGLAMLAGQVRLTKTSSTLGTVAYMSSEQVGSREIDHRTDIWSLGVVFYEMIAGQLPFRGEHEQAMMYSILNEEPAQLVSLRSELPKEVLPILEKALAKEPGRRYQHMSEMLADLKSCEKKLEAVKVAPEVTKHRRLRKFLPYLLAGCGALVALVIFGRIHFFTPRERPITSLAVLPFRNLSADPEQEYFSDGMTEAIIKELSQIRALRVISRTSVMRYRKSEKTVPEIARELGVDAVVEGSVLRADHDVRITAQLIAAHPEKHLWADDFTRTLENVLLLQSEVAQAIAREIKVAVTPVERERMARARVVDPEAHEAYLKGKYFLGKSTPRDWNRSIEYFQQAIDKDTTYALAYAGMAEAYDNLGSMGTLPPREARPKVKGYTEKALTLDPTLAEGILLIADVKFGYDWDVKGAEEYYKRALELDPNLALAHYWYGFYLTSQGRFDEGIAAIKRATHLDPLSPGMPGMVAFAYGLAGEYDSASVYLQRTAEIDSSDASIYWTKSSLHLRQGKYAEAIEDAKKGASRGITPCLGDLAMAYALSGQTGKARESLSKLFESIGDGYYSPTSIAAIYCALGDRERVFEYLEKAYRERDASLVMPALAPPWCDFIKSDPRYHDLMKRVGVEK